MGVPRLTEVLAQSYTLGDPKLIPDPQRSLVPAYSFRGPRLTPGISEFLGQIYFLGGPRLKPRPQKSLLRPNSSVVAPLYLLLLSLLSQACSSLGHWLSPVSVNVHAVDPLLLLWSLLPQAFSFHIFSVG